MRDELARSMDKLRLAELARPYFIAYHVHDVHGLGMSATCGSLLSSHESRGRTLTVEVRVGDYAFDNTNFLSLPSFSMGSVHPWFSVSQLPFDDNYTEIRRQIWLATDAAYKQALESLAGKRAALENKTRTETLPDFSKEDRTQTMDVEPAAEIKTSDAEALVRDLSKPLAGSELYSSTVGLTVRNAQTVYLNSEGTSYEKARPVITLTANASTQAADGLRLGDSVSFYASSFDSLPPRKELAKQIGEMAARLETLRNAPLLDRYNGPVLFEGRAAAEIFSEEFALRWWDSGRPSPATRKWKSLSNASLSAEGLRLRTRSGLASCRIS